MDTMEGGRKRRRHSAEFKAMVVAASRQPGVSVAAVALAHWLNANLLRRWVVQAQHDPREAQPAPAISSNAIAPAPAFIPLPLTPSTPTEPTESIRIELIRGGTTIRLQWPLPAAAHCATWLQQLL